MAGEYQLATLAAAVDIEEDSSSVPLTPPSSALANGHRPKQSPSDFDERPSSPADRPGQLGLWKLALSSMVAAGVQFGWALQLSLLTPYIQMLGIEHALSSFIWLCGPITGLVVQPCIGMWSDQCTSKYGRRRPFIATGVAMIMLSVIVIGFAADIGSLLGDSHEDCSVFKGVRPRAVFVFILGFWLLDLANNTVQGPARALLADLAGSDQRVAANAIFCLWMALGNILGFSAGAYGGWYKLFPFLTSKACCAPCANLKAAFLLAILFLAVCTVITMVAAQETPVALVVKEQQLTDFGRREEQEARTKPHDDSAALIQKQQSNGKLHDLALVSVDVDHANGHHAHEETILHDVPHFGRREEQEAYTKPHDDSAPLLQKQQSNGMLHDLALVSVGVDHTNGHHAHEETILQDLPHSDPQAPPIDTGLGSTVVNLLLGVRKLPGSMKFVLVVMALCWLSWFPFFLFDTDWMGREVFHGDPTGTADQIAAYERGVQEGAFGLLLNSVVLGISSLFIDFLSQKLGSKNLWAIGNFTVFLAMACTGLITLATPGGHGTGSRVAAVALFTVLGFPLAITYSVPYSVTAELTADSGGGQGLAMGVLNLAVVVPQTIVALGAGPWDALFGGGNEPAFGFASVSALAAGVIALWKLPRLARHGYRPAAIMHGPH